MPISLANMALNEKSVTFPVGDDTCTVTYFPGRVNDTILTQMDTDLPSRNAALAGIIKDWDFYEDEAMTIVVPIDVEHLEKVNVTFKSLLVRAISGDMRPN